MKFIERGVTDKTMVQTSAAMCEPDQLIGDIMPCDLYDIGHRRLVEMMAEFELRFERVFEFILTNSHIATLERIAALPNASASGHMRIDGYDRPVDLHVTVTIKDETIITDFEGTSGLDKKGINVPLVYTWPMPAMP